MDGELASKTSPDEQFNKLCSYLIKRYSEEEGQKRKAKTREILALVGKGLLAAGMLLTPNYKNPLSYGRDNPTWAEFDKYSKYYSIPELKRTLKRLEKQKMIVVKENSAEQRVELTNKGKKSVFKYAVGEFDVRKPDIWDGKWRIIIYDVTDKKKKSRDILRSTLKRLGFLLLQKSVYLFPYPCGEEIEFLRAYYGLDKEVTMLVTSKIENDNAYRDYFGI